MSEMMKIPFPHFGRIKCVGKWPEYQPVSLGRGDYLCHGRVSRPHPSPAQTPQLMPVRTGP